MPPDWFISHMAGGPSALLRAVEDAEDNAEWGGREIRESVKPGDVVVGLAASGRTPYVAGALRAARAIGASTALVSLLGEVSPEQARAALAESGGHAHLAIRELSESA